MSEHKMSNEKGSECGQCGMWVKSAKDYHPYAACLMFKACRNGNTVQANLDAVIAYAKQQVPPTTEHPYRVRAFWSNDRRDIVTVCVSHEDISVLDENGNIWEATGPEQDMSSRPTKNGCQ